MDDVSSAESVALVVIEALVKAVPSFASWLASILVDDDTRPFTRRVRDILPERSASRVAADALRDGR